MRLVHPIHICMRPLAVLVSVTALLACGGSDVVSPGSGGTGEVTTTAVGPIAGFGSVIVNGVRYDDSLASVANERGDSLARDDLRLGMMVAVQGSSSQSGTGQASSITVFSEIKGVISTLTADGFVVNGTAVRRVTSTLIDGAANLAVGDFVEVYGVYDATNNAVIATRIEKKSADDFKLRGRVSSWNPGTSTFTLGTTPVSYAGTSLPAGFAEGVSVRAYATGGPSADVWPVADIRLVDDQSRLSGQRIEIKGVVTAYTSIADFVLGDIPVDGSGATVRDGIAADVRQGAWLEVEGSLIEGRLIATDIEIEDGPGSSGNGVSSEFEIKGLITNFVSPANFMVRNTRIDASQSPTFEDGDAAQLANGVCVEIKGLPVSNTNELVIRAQEIKFDNDC